MSSMSYPPPTLNQTNNLIERIQLHLNRAVAHKPGIEAVDFGVTPEIQIRGISDMDSGQPPIEI